MARLSACRALLPFRAVETNRVEDIMNLDDFTSFKQLDPQNMLGEIDNLPRQVQSAWDLGQNQPLPDGKGIRRIIISGMGGSAIGADLLAAYIAPVCKLPVIVHRDYGLPAWAHGSQTLFVASSHSGNTEETLDAFDAAVKAGCTLLAVCTGGELDGRVPQPVMYRFGSSTIPGSRVPQSAFRSASCWPFFPGCSWFPIRKMICSKRWRACARSRRQSVLMCRSRRIRPNAWPGSWSGAG